MPAFVILSEAKNLVDLGIYTSEILRLTPQNDVVGQPLTGTFELWRKRYSILDSSSRPSPAKRDASRDPDNVPAKSGNQTPNDVIEVTLDSPSTLLRVVSLSNHGPRSP